MADYLTTDTELTSVADAIRTKGGTSASLVYPTGFVNAIEAISTGTDVSDTTAVVGDVLSGKYFHIADGTKVQGTIATKTSSNLSANGKTVTVPAGYYASQATKDVSTLTLPTSVSSSAISGYTLKATIGRSTSDQYINIGTGYNETTGYYKISAVANGSATTPATTITSAPTISINTSTGVITASNSKTQNVTPTVNAGYVSSGTAGTITVSGSNTYTLDIWTGGNY